MPNVGTSIYDAIIHAMETAEVYFRIFDRAVAKENFLEKEMLDSDVHHLEVQGNFFDKLAVLGAGSLAVGISFIVAGFEHASVQVALRNHLWGISIALLLFVVSLTACILHNFLISVAVSLLSSQLECLYKAANKYRRFRENRPYNEPITQSSAEHNEIEAFNKAADSYRDTKRDRIKLASRAGFVALVFLVAGYVVGLSQVVAIFVSVPVSQPTITLPQPNQAFPADSGASDNSNF